MCVCVWARVCLSVLNLHARCLRLYFAETNTIWSRYTNTNNRCELYYTTERTASHTWSRETFWNKVPKLFAWRLPNRRRTPVAVLLKTVRTRARFCNNSCVHNSFMHSSLSLSRVRSCIASPVCVHYWIISLAVFGRRSWSNNPS